MPKCVWQATRHAVYAWGLLQVDAWPVLAGQDGAEGAVAGICEALPQGFETIASKRVVDFKQGAEPVCVGDESSEGRRNYTIVAGRMHQCQDACLCLHVTGNHTL
jgi:hypothetical protein